MKEDSFWTIIKADFQRYKGSGKNSVWKTIRSLYHHESLIIIILFRLTQKARQLNPVLSLPLKLIYKIPSIFLGIHINFKAKIGKGFYIMHYGGIFIGAIEMGKYCNVSQQVTIGHGGRDTDRYGVPKIGDYVWIGPGAKIFGKIKIGDNVSIGANTVVSKDIPDNAIVVGNPGRIVGYQEKNICLDNL